MKPLIKLRKSFYIGANAIACDLLGSDFLMQTQEEALAAAYYKLVDDPWRDRVIVVQIVAVVARPDTMDLSRATKVCRMPRKKKTSKLV